MYRFSRRMKAGALATLTVAGTVGILGTMTCYALKINGETIGTARNLYSIREAVSNTEEKLTDTLGYEYSLDTQVTAVFATSVMDTQELEEEIIHNIPDVELLWAINVDGETVGACKTKDEADEIIQSILDMYTTNKTKSVEILQDVRIEEMYVSTETLQDREEIASLLDPKNEASDYALSIFTVSEETEFRVYPCEIEYYDTQDLYEGEYQVITDGVDMEAYVTVEVESVNGNEILRTDLTSITLVQPVTEEIARGITPRPLTASYGEFVWPAEGVITSDFGYRSVSVGSSNHKGIDIAGAANSDIMAADGGEVIFAGENGGYGNMVQLRHDNGTVTYYAHCSSLAVSVGERVARGQTIAYMGTTGVSTGVHLHFEVRVDDKAQDPMEYLPSL